ncbi:lysosome membrane protein 2c [Clupea harengus]|uniref:Lysosome membrane protein 2c n=1 Tax=Clupea harengus TaxID=7950 RepID=A0A6P3VZQ8_CLUHA|nr:lysosome membrane protein 2c [Clupea harengus]
MSKSCCVYCTGVLCILLLIAGISMELLQIFPNTVYNRIKSEVVLKKGTDAFAAWENPPPPVYMQFYMFNLTNPIEVLAGNKPAVVELGPYTYREYRPMLNVTFLENGTKVEAVNPKTYVFEASMSRGAETDLIRTVNIPAMTVMEKVKDTIISGLIANYMKGEGIGLFTTVSVGDLLWGYEDKLLEAAKAFDPTLDSVFGLFYKMNATDDGDYVFYSGSQNYQDFSRVALWKGQSSLDWWTSDECNMINGTNGASFHPLINKNETLSMFSSDLCRSLYAVFEKELWVKNLPAYRFVPPSEVFANLTINPGNAGFCVPAGNCLGSGLLNVSPCKQGAPIIMSSPHFYQADEKFVEDVIGMKPKKEYHETAIDLNPLTGIVLRAAKRMQVNVMVEKIDGFSQTGNVSTLVFPVMYLNESVVIDDASAKKLRSVVIVSNVVINIPFMVVGLGILLGIVFMVLMCRKNTPESSPAERQALLKP